MEKIRPKVVFVVLALCVSSWVFAEESSSESTKPPQEVENTGEIGPRS